jgi:2-iminobutanoate/2-iminopropanoate deaminase
MNTGRTTRRTAVGALLTAGLLATAPSAHQATHAQETQPVTRTLHARQVAVPPVPALTSGLVDGEFVHITGQLAFDSEVGGIAPGLDAAGQTEVIMRRIDALLRAEGLTTADLVKVTIFVTDPADVFPMNSVYARWVQEPLPARSTVGVAFLALPGAKVEIEGTARRR